MDCQHAKKVVSNNLGPVDFAIRLVNSVLNLPDGQVIFFLGNSNYRRNVINPAHQIFFRLVEMTFGLVHASYSLPEWQAVKLTFFAPWLHWKPVSLTVLQTSFLLFLTFEMTWYNATQIIGNICLILSCSFAIHKLKCISQVPSQTWMVIKFNGESILTLVSGWIGVSKKAMQ